MLSGIFFVDKAEPVAGYLRHIIEVAVDAFHFSVHACNEFVRLVLIKLQDTRHLDFEQAKNIVLCNLTNHLWVEGCEALVNMFTRSVNRFCVFKSLVLINALLDKNTFERSKMQAFKELATADFKFALEEVLRIVHRRFEHIAHADKSGRLVVNHTAVRRNANLTIREGIEGVDSFVGTCARHKVYEDFHISRRHIFHLAHLNLTLLGSLQNAFDKGTLLLRRAGRLAVGNFSDSKCLVVALLNLGTHSYGTTTLTVVVLTHVNKATRLEVGIELELFALQIADGSLAEFAKVVGQDFRGKPYGNPFSALSEQERELHGKTDRFLISTIV